MRYRNAPALLLLLAFLTGPAQARFRLPELAPVDRIIENTEAYVEEHPEDAKGYYVLGRAHYLAWTLNSDMIPVNQWPREEKADLPNLPEKWIASMGHSEGTLRFREAERRVREEWGLAENEYPTRDKFEEYSEAVKKAVEDLKAQNWKPPAPALATLDAHAEAAIKHHRKAIELDEANGLYHIGLASILEEYAERGGERSLLPELEMSNMPKELVTPRWHQAALDGYAKAYRLSIREDRKLNERPIAGLESLVSYNAIEGYTRMAQKLDGEGVDRDLARQMKEDKAKLDGLRMGAITPIILSLEPGRTLDDLLLPETPEHTVRFDLDGDGHAEKRPWVKPDTALLVWDPTGEGRIASGRQLFGSVTWWLMPGDGYTAMSLLDDNRDGELAGNELPGLALWFDRNANAVSEPGEVIPIDQTDIVGLKAEALTHDDSAPMHPQGLRLRDGRTLPTWDWIAPAVAQ